MKIHIPKSWFMKRAHLKQARFGCGVNPFYAPKPPRNSIQPSYDHRETGDRFTVSSSINGFTVCDHKKLRDPFVRHTIRVHWWDAIKALFDRGHIEINVTVDGDHEICEEIMELDNDYKGEISSSRRKEWDEGIEKSLSETGGEP